MLKLSNFSSAKLSQYTIILYCPVIKEHCGMAELMSNIMLYYYIYQKLIVIGGKAKKQQHT